MLDHRRTAATGRDDRVDASLVNQRPEDVEEMPGHLTGVVPVSGIEGGLPAAGLPVREDDFRAVTFEKIRCGQADAGIERVDHAGDEQCGSGAGRCRSRCTHELKDTPALGCPVGGWYVSVRIV